MNAKNKACTSMAPAYSLTSSSMKHSPRRLLSFRSPSSIEERVKSSSSIDCDVDTVASVDRRGFSYRMGTLRSFGEKLFFCVGGRHDKGTEGEVLLRGCRVGELRVALTGLNQNNGLPLSFFFSDSGRDLVRRMGEGGGETCIVD